MKMLLKLWTAIIAFFDEIPKDTRATKANDVRNEKPNRHNTWTLCWGNHTSKQFNDELVNVVKRLGWGAEEISWLMACMAFETGKTFSSKIKNLAGSGATGLIQFMPNTALGLGTTVTELREMSPVSQLRYVELYFKPYKNKINSLNDMYMAILMPKYIKADDSTTIFSEGKWGFRQNAGLDINKDGRITKAEACYRVNRYWIEGLQEENVGDVKAYIS
jgi:hypothetical protein